MRPTIDADPATRSPFGPPEDGRCQAEGCPNRWTSHREREKYLCNAHAVAPPGLWGLVTDNQLRTAAQVRAARLEPPMPSVDELDAIRARLRGLRAELAAARVDRVAWARRLRERERGGRALTRFQQGAWRDVLPVAPLDTGGEAGAPDDEPAALPPLAMETDDVDDDPGF
jgi:hypothetical protein